MKAIEKYHLINDYLLELIKKGNTGTPEELCQRINVTERTLFRYIEELKLQGEQITYCRRTQSYVLDNLN